MDHREVEARDVVERYLQGKLQTAETEAFEEHLMDCPECFDRVRWESDFQQTLCAAAAEEVVRTGVWTWLARRRAGWLLSLLLAAGVPTALLVREHSRPGLEPRINTPIVYLDTSRDATVPQRLVLPAEGHRQRLGGGVLVPTASRARELRRHSRDRRARSTLAARRPGRRSQRCLRHPAAGRFLDARRLHPAPRRSGCRTVPATGQRNLVPSRALASHELEPRLELIAQLFRPRHAPCRSTARLPAGRRQAPSLMSKKYSCLGGTLARDASPHLRRPTNGAVDWN